MVCHHNPHYHGYRTIPHSIPIFPAVSSHTVPPTSRTCSCGTIEYTQTAGSTAQRYLMPLDRKRFVHTEEGRAHYLRYCSNEVSSRPTATPTPTRASEPSIEHNNINIVDFCNDTKLLQYYGSEWLEAVLVGIVEESKTNPRISTAAANALSILVHKGYAFNQYPKRVDNYADLRAISVAKANLRNGNFNWVNFGGAVMSGVNLCGAYLGNSILER